MRAICFCLFLIYPFIAGAQEAENVNCRFLCLDRTSPPPPLIASSGDGIEIPCTVPVSALSAGVACVAIDHTINFLSAADRKPVAKVTIPANLKSAILIFVPAAKAPDGLLWRVFAIDDSIKNMPDGGAFVTNFHSQDIRFVIGESKHMLRPGGSQGVARPDKRDDFNMAPVAFQFLQGETWKDASESMLRFLPGMRYLMFAYLDSVSGRPKVSTFQDLSSTAPVIKAKS